jgi:hypothetical protein
MRRLRSLASSRLLQAALLLALAVRVLVPVGYMAGGDVASGFTMQLCTMGGLHTVEVPADPASPAPSQQHADAPCLFALAAAAGPPPHVAAQVPSAAGLTTPSSGYVARAFVPSVVRSQSSRGPPAHA